jgi:hypothetical protein
LSEWANERMVDWAISDWVIECLSEFAYGYGVPLTRPTHPRDDVRSDQHCRGKCSSESRRARPIFGYALASLWEVEGHLQLSSDLEMMSKKDYETLLDETINVRRMLYGLLKKERTWDEQKPQRRKP